MQTKKKEHIQVIYKVRIFTQGGIIHTLSRMEPRIETSDSRIDRVYWEPVVNSEHGDSVGFVAWQEVLALTWRKMSAAEIKETGADSLVFERRKETASTFSTWIP